ncbi:unnamed protein product [Adineta ricciae]|uniref:Gnk2-homologous domain-containing protein n=1 Tax=Adineta ricciae TaxID=249248 RepID=A0A815K828_ADIRI|nr:unnamed protein product [Adineta ricciae]CAF1392068.1 unnamed protein product [Adineta ricciae]
MNFQFIVMLLLVVSICNIKCTNWCNVNSLSDQQYSVVESALERILHKRGVVRNSQRSGHGLTIWARASCPADWKQCQSCIQRIVDQVKSGCPRKEGAQMELANQCKIRYERYTF